VSGERPAAAPERFVAGRSRIVGRRPAVLAAGLIGRLGALDAYTAWPDAATPLQLLPAGDARVCEWIRATFEPWADRRLGHATWNVLRAGSVVLARSPGLAVAAAETALGRPLDRPAVGCVSASGHAQSKLLCFVFEGDAARPEIVVKGVPEPGEGPRLVAETRLVERIRERVAADREVVAGMPPAPLWIGAVGAEELVVEPVDPLAVATGEEDGGAALEWLARFQAATSEEDAAWGSDAELSEMTEAVAFAWGEARPDRRADAVAAFERLAADLRGTPVPTCPVHGDFWRGNVACADGALRVYDWEWASISGRPFFDIWTYELGSLRHDPPETVDGLVDALREASGRVEGQLARRGLDPRFARATLAPVVAQLTFRVRRVRGQAPANEARAVQLVCAVERLLDV
jgi:Phosphotransferase enzyme family